MMAIFYYFGMGISGEMVDHRVRFIKGLDSIRLTWENFMV